MPNSMPWSKFYWSDWSNCANLRRCSKAAKGMWIDVLALMAECEDRGVLASGGVPWSDEDIAAAVTGDPTENLVLLRELFDKGVPSRSKTGAVYSRRMVRDEEIRLKRADAGSKGGSKCQANYEAKLKQTLSESESVSESSHQRGDARGETQGEPPGFAEWWAVYPHKVGPAAARDAFAIAIGKTDLPTLLAGVVAYKRAKPADRPWCNPATWLNEERWLDQPAAPDAARREVSAAHTQEVIERQRAEREAARANAMTPEERRAAIAEAKRLMKRSGGIATTGKASER